MKSPGNQVNTLKTVYFYRMQHQIIENTFSLLGESEAAA